MTVEYYRCALEYGLGDIFTDGNEMSVLRNGVEIFPAMLGAIEAARRSIEFVTFVYWSGDIAERMARALADAAARGVRAQVLLDAFGAKPMAAELIDKMKGAGVEIRWFRPLSTFRVWRQDKRTHRKILVCDGEVAFTGGVGIAEEWTGDARTPSEWRDTHVRVAGPAVTPLQASFRENWTEAGPWRWHDPSAPPQPRSNGVPMLVTSASTTVGWTKIATLLRTLVSIARRRIQLTTAYFNPDPALQELLVEALKNGVEVELLTPGRYTDSRLSQLAGYEAIERLLDAGAKIWSYDPTTLHAKITVIDDLVCCVGSANLNYRSVGKDEECCVVGLCADNAARLSQQFEHDCSRSARLSLNEWRARGWTLRIRERLARLIVEQL